MSFDFQISKLPGKLNLAERLSVHVATTENALVVVG